MNQRLKQMALTLGGSLLLPFYVLGGAARAVELAPQLGSVSAPKAGFDWYWAVNAQKAVELLAVIELDQANLPDKTKPTITAGGVLPSQPGKTGLLRLATKSANPVLKWTSSSGKPQEFSVKFGTQELGIQERGCAPLGIKTRSLTKGSLPFYLGVNCQKSGQDILVSVSTPSEFVWGESRSLELAGKGERWKQFSMSKSAVPLETGSGLSFSIGRGETFWSFEVAPVVKIAPVKKEPEKSERGFISGAVGAGPWLLSSNTNLLNQSNLEPGITAKVAIDPNWIKLKFVTDFYFAMPVGSSDSHLQYYSLTPALSRSFGSSFQFETRLLYSILGIDYSPTQLSLRHNQLGVGGFLHWLGAADRDFIVGADLSGYFSGGTATKLIHGELEYLFPKSGNKQWGAKVVYETLSFTSATDTGSFRQILFNALLLF